MEAFPLIAFITDDVVLAAAIPEQLAHVFSASCIVLPCWEKLAEALRSKPPGVALIDCATCKSSLPELTAFRAEYPLLGLLGIGSAEEESLFSSLPLSYFVSRPVAIPALLRQLEKLSYERMLNGGQQRLPLPGMALFLPSERIIVSESGNSLLELTDKESAILLCLYHHRQTWISREELLEEVWGYGNGIATHTLETHLYRLRAKLRDALGNETLVVTGQNGYRLNLEG